MFDIIGFVVFGLVVGVIARILKRGRQDLGLIATALLGMAGSVIGGLIASLIGTGRIMELDFLGTVFAVIAAVLLVGTAEAMFGKSKKRQLN